jgi:hypothetical protein
MEGNDVCKIFVMVAFAPDLLADSDTGFAFFSDCLAFDASVEANRHHGGSLFPVHQSFVYAPRQSPRRLISGTSH